MLETVLTLVLAIALMWYIYTCHRNSYEVDSAKQPLAFQAAGGYPVVQYPDLPFARPSVPRSADPRVINPKLAVAPVQFPQPKVFGAYGVTDSVAPVWSAGKPKPEYVDGEAIRKPLGPRVTTLPIRTTAPAKPVEVDFVNSELGSLQGGPVELVDANLTPPGMARPMSEWAWINYGSQ